MRGRGSGWVFLTELKVMCHHRMEARGRQRVCWARLSAYFEVKKKKKIPRPEINGPKRAQILYMYRLQDRNGLRMGLEGSSKLARRQWGPICQILPSFPVLFN